MSLKSKAIGGAKWTTASTIIVSILQFVQLGILTNYLEPTVFGLMGMITIVMGIALSLSDIGISNAIIYKKDITSNQLSSLYFLNIVLGLLITILILCVSPLISKFYQEPDLNILLLLTSSIFIIYPFGQQFQILMQKELELNKLAKIEVIGSITGTLTSIFLAIMGFSLISIVLGQIINILVKTIIYLNIGLKRWKPSLHFQVSDIKEFIVFGSYQLGERVIKQIIMNLDNILIGKFLGAEALGFYTVAYNLIIIPSQKIILVISRVFYPYLAKMQDNIIKIQETLLSCIKTVSFLVVPMFLGIFTIAPVLIPLLFGEEWSESIIIVQFMSIIVIIKLCTSPIFSAFLSLGRADISFKWNIFLIIIQFPILLLAIKLFGLIGIILANVIFSILFELIVLSILNKSILKIELNKYFKSLLPAALCGTLMTISIILLIETFHISNIVMLILIGILSYLLFSYIIQRKQLIVIKSVLSFKKKGMS